MATRNLDEQGSGMVQFVKKIIAIIALVTSFSALTHELPTVFELLSKYDLDENLELNRVEFDKSFSELEPYVIKAFLFDDSTKKYAHSAFLYVGVHHRVPSMIDLAKFHYLTSKAKIVLSKADLFETLYMLEEALQ